MKTTNVSDWSGRASRTIPSAVQTHVCISVPRHNMMGQSLDADVLPTNETISKGLATRLHRHAVQRMEEAGFGCFVQSANVSIYTMDGDEKPADRAYTVRFMSEKGGYIEVSGIATRHGWPTLDYGFYAGAE